MAWFSILYVLSLLVGQGLAGYDSGYWTPQSTTQYYTQQQTTQYYQSTTQYWTPSPTTQYWTPSPTTQYWTPTTTSYWSTYTPLTTYVTCYTQQNVVVTVTSVLPCPVTSTVVYWECCDQCQNNCQNPPTTYQEPSTFYGTTTLTSFTTTTPGMATLQTVTSNGLVIVMVSSMPVSQSVTPSIVYQVSNQAASPLHEGAWSSFWTLAMFLAVIATLMILL